MTTCEAAAAERRRLSTPVITLASNLDLAESERVRRKLLEQPAPGPEWAGTCSTVTLNGQAVETIGTPGLQVLLAAWERRSGSPAEVPAVEWGPVSAALAGILRSAGASEVLGLEGMPIRQRGGNRDAEDGTGA